MQKSRARASKQSLHDAAAALLLPQRASAYWCWCGDGVGGGGAGAKSVVVVMLNRVRYKI